MELKERHAMTMRESVGEQRVKEAELPMEWKPLIRQPVEEARTEGVLGATRKEGATP